MLREREKKTLILIHCVYLQLRKYIYIYIRLGVLPTIHVTYIKKERLYTINSLYSTDVMKQSHRTGEYKSVSLSIERKEYVWNPKVPLKVDIFAWEVVWGKYLEVGPAHKWGRELLNK